MNLVNQLTRFRVLVTSFTAVICMMLSLQVVAKDAIKIGIVLGKHKGSSSASSLEKECVIDSIAQGESTYFRGNKKVEFIFATNERTAIGSANAAKHLVEDGASFVLLPLLSHEASVSAQVLAKAGIPYITSATARDVIRDSYEGVSIMPSNAHQASVLSDFYWQNYRNAPLYILANRARAYSEELAQLFAKQITLKDSQFHYERVAFSTPKLQELVKTLPDGAVLFAPLYNPNIALLYKALSQESQRANKNFTIIGPDSIGGRKEFFDIVGDEIHNDKTKLFFIRNWDYVLKSDADKDLLAIVKSFCNKQSATFLNTYSYDMMRFAVKVAERKLSEPYEQSFFDLIKTTPYRTVMDGAPLIFDENGYNLKPLYLYKATEKGIELYQTLGTK